ncbi:MAG: hypothetical protein HY904_08770 [Deltaproteobacteria bacterium]|nr:hypothetical protein [Deltaproteobacteria bacterium]
MKPILLGVPPHRSDPTDGLHVWLMDPPGVLDCASAAHMSGGMVQWLTGPATEDLPHIFGKSTQLAFVHDWRRVRSYDLSARARLVAWGLQMGPRVVKSILILLSPESPAMVRMACHAGVVPFAMAGIKVSVDESGDYALATLGARPHPPPTTPPTGA